MLWSIWLYCTNNCHFLIGPENSPFWLASRSDLGIECTGYVVGRFLFFFFRILSTHPLFFGWSFEWAPCSVLTFVVLATNCCWGSSRSNRRGYPWTSALSPKLKAAVNQLVGEGAWEEFGCGWWVVTFPGFAQPPWRVEGRWHVDGAHFRHYPHRYGMIRQGVLVVCYFGDVTDGDWWFWDWYFEDRYGGVI